MILVCVAGCGTTPDKETQQTPSTQNPQPAAPNAPAASPEKLYTAYNMWFENSENFLAINYKKGMLIPAGTEVSNVGVASTKRTPMIAFTTVKNGQTFNVGFVAKYHPGLSAQDYVKKMFTGKNFEALTAGMTQNEVKAIKEGRLVIGMSKAAVLVAYGYPPEHRTPSLSSNTWIYWIDRFRNKAILFDENGRTCKPAVATTDEL